MIVVYCSDNLETSAVEIGSIEEVNKPLVTKHAPTRKYNGLQDYNYNECVGCARSYLSFFSSP